jgi:hypothetical protein
MGAAHPRSRRPLDGSRPSAGRSRLVAEVLTAINAPDGTDRVLRIVERV